LHKTLKRKSRKKGQTNSTQDRAEDLAVHIGQAAFVPIVIKGQSLVIHSQKVQDGGMEIMLPEVL